VQSIVIDREVVRDLVDDGDAKGVSEATADRLRRASAPR